MNNGEGVMTGDGGSILRVVSNLPYSVKSRFCFDAVCTAKISVYRTRRYLKLARVNEYHTTKPAQRN